MDHLELAELSLGSRGVVTMKLAHHALHASRTSLIYFRSLAKTIEGSGELAASLEKFLTDAENEIEEAINGVEVQLARKQIEATDNLRELFAQNEAFEILGRLRKQGLMVVVHNDYRLHGKKHTFWVMSTPHRHADEMHIIPKQGHVLDFKFTVSFKGEGETDKEALEQIEKQFNDFLEATKPRHTEFSMGYKA